MYRVEAPAGVDPGISSGRGAGHPGRGEHSRIGGKGDEMKRPMGL